MKLSKLQWKLWEFVTLRQPVSIPDIEREFPMSALNALCEKGILKVNSYNHIEEVNR